MGSDSHVRTERVVPMNGPGDGARFLLTALLAFWVMAYAYSLTDLPSLADVRGAEGSGPDFASALHFLGWQGIAGILAFSVYGVSRLWPRGAAARQLGNLPLALAFLLVAVVAAIVFADELGTR